MIGASLQFVLRVAKDGLPFSEVKRLMTSLPPLLVDPDGDGRGRQESSIEFPFGAEQVVVPERHRQTTFDLDIHISIIDR